MLALQGKPRFRMVEIGRFHDAPTSRGVTRPAAVTELAFVHICMTEHAAFVLDLGVLRYYCVLIIVFRLERRVTLRALDIAVSSRQNKFGAVVIEAGSGLPTIHCMTALAGFLELPSVNVSMTTRACSGRTAVLRIGVLLIRIGRRNRVTSDTLNPTMLAKQRKPGLPMVKIRRRRPGLRRMARCAVG